MIFLNRWLPVTCVATFVSALGGCTADKVLFMTQTSLGVGFDAASAKGHIGYDRQEILVSPDYPDGGHLPVTSSINSNLSFTAPQTKQFFATGDAALIASQRIAAPNLIDRSDEIAVAKLSPGEKCSLNLGCAWSMPDDRRQSVLATNSHVGLIVSTKDASLATLDFGLGRQEVAYMPVQQKTGHGGDVLPSALASIDVRTKENGGGVTVSQYFASGGAADALASNRTVMEAVDYINQIKGVEAAAVEQQRATDAAKSLGIAPPTFKQFFAKGQVQAATADQRLGKVMGDLVGAGRDGDDSLSADDKAKIRPVVGRVLGQAGISEATSKDARALEDSATVKELRRTIKDNNDLLNRMYASTTAS